MNHTHSGDGTVSGLHGEPIPAPVLGCPACATVHSIGDELGATPEGSAPSLPEFLMARIAEDEEVAKSAAPGPWRIARSEDGRYAEVVSPANSLTDVVVLGAGGEFCGDLWLAADEADLAHITRHDPASVLAECEAKRRIVEWMTTRKDLLVLRCLALPYADHPAYRPEWRP